MTHWVSHPPGGNSILLFICIEAPESKINFLLSGLTVEVDAIAHFLFEECFFVFQTRSSNSVQLTAWPIAKLLFCHLLLPTTCCLEHSPPTKLDHSQRWFQLYAKCDESFCSFRVFEFNKSPWRSLAALLQDGPSHVRESNRLS